MIAARLVSITLLVLCAQWSIPAATAQRFRIPRSSSVAREAGTIAETPGLLTRLSELLGLTSPRPRAPLNYRPYTRNTSKPGDAWSGYGSTRRGSSHFYKLDERTYQLHEAQNELEGYGFLQQSLPSDSPFLTRLQSLRSGVDERRGIYFGVTYDDAVRSMLIDRAKDDPVAQRLFAERLEFDEKLRDWTVNNLPLSRGAAMALKDAVTKNPAPFLAAVAKEPDKIGTVIAFNERWRQKNSARTGGYIGRLSWPAWTNPPLYAQLSWPVKSFVLSLGRTYDVDVIAPQGMFLGRTFVDPATDKYRDILRDLGFYGMVRPKATGIGASFGIFNFKTAYGIRDGDESMAFLTAETRAAIDKVVQYKQVAMRAALGQTDLSEVTPTSALMTFQRRGNDTYALIRNQVAGTRPELWVLNDELDVTQRVLGQPAIEKMDDVTHERIAEFAKQGGVFFHFGSHDKQKPKESVRIQFGGRRHAVTWSEVQNLFRIGGRTPTLDRIFRASRNPTGGRTQVILLRDAFFQSSLGSVAPDDPILDAKFDLRRQHLNPTRLVIELKRKYGSSFDFVLDDKMKEGLENSRNLPTVSEGADLAVYTSPRLDDWDTLAILAPTLESARITIVDGVTYSPHATIVVITGHKNPDFKNVLIGLASNGALRNKLVVLFSCGAVGDELLNSMLVSKGGARAVLFFPDEIHPLAVQAVTIEMSRRLEGALPESIRIDVLLEQAIEACLSDVNTSVFIRGELARLRRSVLQVSRIRPQTPSNLAS